MAIKVPHFAIPLRFTPGLGAVVTEQDSDQEIEDCVETIIRFPTGQRPEEPTFGIPDQTFAFPTVDLTKIQAAIAKWEPRAHSIVKTTLIDNLINKIRVEGGGS